MKRRRPRKRSTGVLAKPILRPKLPPETILTDESEIAVVEKRRAAARELAPQRIERLFALFDHYEVDLASHNFEHSLMTLVHRMAQDFVPGFRIKVEGERAGRKRRWNIWAQLELIDDVTSELTRDKRKMLSPMGACMRLVRPGRPYARYTATSLHRIYQRALTETPQWRDFLAWPMWRSFRNSDFYPTMKSVSGTW